MKEKIIKILESQFSVVEYEDPDTGFTESTTIDVLTTDEFPDIVDKLEILVNQEVEKRIAERMPSEVLRGFFHELIQAGRDMNDRDRLGLPYLTYDMYFMDFEYRFRSRLTQKTEGGGE